MDPFKLRRCFFIFLLLLIPSVLYAQKNGTHYLSHTLIIKYQDDQTLSELRLNRKGNPKDDIQSFLNTFGASRPHPILDPAAPLNIKGKSGRSIGNNEVEKAATELRRIYTVHYVADVDAAWLAAKVSQLPGVEYAEPRYLRFDQYQPNDGIVNPYQSYHDFYDAWDVTKGSSDVVIAIIDSGVDYNHTDLDGKLWNNDDEIADNGVDDDQNGFVDDVIGWDFWGSGTINNPSPDNDPMLDANPHGTHVAGIAAAKTDNGEGLSGTGFNSTYMAVKAGGVPDDPATEVDESELIAFGFEGILYAANNGADIINCSWGGGGFSEAENDVIEYATSLGAVVVAAAGNDAAPKVLYPAGYDDVIAAGSVDTGGSRASYSNYGYGLDVLATGTNIRSTIGNNQYATYSGTSMATPVVSGLAALLRAEYPGWSAKRIATQIRATAEPLTSQGNEYENKLGNGKINAYRALTTEMPGIRVIKVDFLNENGEKLGFEEQGHMTITVANYGVATSGLTIDAKSLSGDGLQISSPTSQVGTIATNDTTEATIPIRITNAFDLDQIPTIRLGFSDPGHGYSDFGVVQYNDLLYDVMAENRVKMSISADGTIGFTNPLDQMGGVGFIPRDKTDSQYEDRTNLLFEGGLMLQMNGGLHDAVRTSDGNVSRDFYPRSTFRVHQQGAADLRGGTQFATDTVNNVAANIRLTSYAYDDPDLSNVVFLLYEVENPSSFFELKNLYAGLFNDWDIGASASFNGISYSQQDSILYVFDEDPQSTQPTVAVAALGPQSGALAIDNAAEGRGLDFGVYDGFTDEEKMRSLNAGTGQKAVSETDVSAVVSSGPYTVGANASVKIGFVYAFGDDLEELRSQIADARSRKPFTVSKKGRVVSDQKPETTEIFQNYPNPFNPSTRIRIDLAQESHVNISIYDVLGRKVAELVDDRLDPRIHIFNFDGDGLSSGVYFARLKTDTRTKTIKMLLVK